MVYNKLKAVLITNKLSKDDKNILRIMYLDLSKDNILLNNNSRKKLIKFCVGYFVDNFFVSNFFSN